MGDDSPPAAPAPVIISPPPSTQETALQSAMGSAEGLKYILDQGLLPRYAQTQTDIQAAQAPQLAQQYLDIQKSYGPQLVSAAMDQLKMSDPEGFAIRQRSGQLINEQLGADQFGKLSPEEQRQAEQDIRAGQVARGGGTSLGDTIQETLAKYGAGRNVQQQQLSNAGSFLAGTPPSANFGGLNQAAKTAPVQSQDVSQAFGTLVPGANNLMANQANMYGTYANFTGNNNALNSSNYWAQQDRTSNPFVTGLTTAASIAGKFMPLAMCWVARSCYGETNPKWLQFRHWMLNYAPNWLVEAYVAYGEQFSKFIENKPMIKWMIRKLMDSRIKSMEVK